MIRAGRVGTLQASCSFQSQDSNKLPGTGGVPWLITQAITTQALITQALITQAIITQALITQAIIRSLDSKIMVL